MAQEQKQEQRKPEPEGEACTGVWFSHVVTGDGLKSLTVGRATVIADVSGTVKDIRKMRNGDVRVGIGTHDGQIHTWVAFNCDNYVKLAKEGS